jgi:hypothetical protein
MAEKEKRRMQPEIGLCASCRHARRSGNARGSSFWQCLRARCDARFARYPRLPVTRCGGHEAGVPEGAER